MYKEQDRLRKKVKPVQDEERSDTESVTSRDDESNSGDEMKSVKALDDDVESDDNEKMIRYASTLPFSLTRILNISLNHESL